MVKKTTALDEISVQDLAVAVHVIDLASEKGLFKGGDLKPVGDVRERLVAYIKSNVPADLAGTDSTN